MKDKSIADRPANTEVSAFIDKLATTSRIKAVPKRGRLIFAMDATASREVTWDRACHIQAQMFDATIALGGLEIQLCYYHGFEVFQASDWCNDSAALLGRMTAVTCLAGHTQIRKVLQHSVNETENRKVDALVFVGDCMEEDANHLCDLAGQLGLLRLPVFVFQEGHDPIAGAIFKKMAKLTQGAYCHFDAGSAQQLRDLLGAVAVYAAGGRRALEQYEKRQGGRVLQLINQMKRG